MIQVMIDIDGVLLDLEGGLRKEYNRIIEKFYPKQEKWTGRLKEYYFGDPKNKLDMFVVDKALESMNTYECNPNVKMIAFIERMDKEGIDYRIVTARTHRHEETIVYLNKWFGILREKIWFVPVEDKPRVFGMFDCVIEDNPKCTGNNIYLIAHGYNKKHGVIAMRGNTLQITKAVLEVTSSDKKQKKLINEGGR